jgi:metal-responsive CopG/Arc/MetJ family transcriptional regulator
MKENQTRVQFDYSASEIAALDEVVNKTGAATRAEAVRTALKIYDWLINDLQPNDTLEVITPEGTTTLKTKVSLLLK